MLGRHELDASLAHRKSRRLRGLEPAVMRPTRSISSAKQSHVATTNIHGWTASAAAVKEADFLKTRRMTPAQEVANALSMLVPAAWVYAAQCSCWGSCLLATAMCCHAPLSVYYHLRVALSSAGVWPLSCSINNVPRRIDQTGIHLLCSSAAFALSGGSLAFTVTSGLCNALAIRLQWQREVDPTRNQRNMGAAIFLCVVVPMVYRGDWRNLAAALAYGLPGGLCFALYPFG